MTKRVNTDAYMEFVNAVTSEESKDYIPFNSRCFEIQSGDDGIPIHRLITAALGMGAESGEFTEVVKKIVFQGKPVNEDNIFHMKRELGDIMWYWTTACAALDLDPYEVISENQEKLASRYGEKFEVQRSEVRKEGDL